jgi:hypothetical protein
MSRRVRIAEINVVAPRSIRREWDVIKEQRDDPSALHSGLAPERSVFIYQPGVRERGSAKDQDYGTGASYRIEWVHGDVARPQAHLVVGGNTYPAALERVR